MHEIMCTMHMNTHQIQGWMDSKAEQYPNLFQTENYGKSTEGRNMKVLKISTGGGGTKPAVWIDGGIHARKFSIIILS